MGISPVAKDVVIATLGASAALAGLVLVFLGVLVATYQSYSRDTPATVLDRYRNTIKWVLGLFAFGLATVLVATWWLVAGGGDDLYRASLGMFVAQVAGLGVSGIAITKRLVR